MIRSCRIPPLLSRICGDGIDAALVVTNDGELLGSAQSPKSASMMEPDEVAHAGSLVTEIAMDYSRLGNELELLDPTLRAVKNSIQCLIMELDMGLVAVSSAGSDCLVIALADPNAPHGMLKARLTALASHVQEALSPLTEPIA
mmetsp:Transcript_9797/g.13805  ORF Transcript_9797/g.13805 Transcript_9797/m.13805 type:complete len:144 (-) Transcript_9797:142-573(-)